MEKRSGSLITILFLLCILLPVVFINRENGAVSVEENRYLAEFPNPFTRKGFEDWIDDNIGFRSGFVSLHANIMYHLFGLSPTDKIVVGKDGWLFYTGDNNLRIAEGTFPLSEEDMDAIIEGQTEVRDYLAKRDCEYYLILPPSKVSIYYEFLKGNYEVQTTPADEVEAYLKDKTDVNVINLKNSLMSAKQSEQVFLKTDTHWNQLGAYEAYKVIHSEVVPETEEPSVEIFDSLVKGEFSNMMGSSSLLPEEETKATRITDPDAVLVSEADGKEFVYHNDKGNGKTCLMYGDSLFGADWNIRELLAEDFSDFIFIWSYDPDTKKIEEYEPDIVLYDMGERFLNALGAHCRIE